MITVNGRTMTIPEAEEVIGYTNDHLVESREFEVDRYYGELDLDEFTFRLEIAKNDDENGIVALTKTTTEDKINLHWDIRQEQINLEDGGTIQIQLRAYKDVADTSTNDLLWHSSIGRVKVLKSLEATEEFDGDLP